jgi:Rieske Fe-S protein
MDYLAFIGRDPGEAHVYIATGDSGHGMTHGTLAGIILADLIHGADIPWAKLYDPSRKPLKAAREFARENANVAWQYTDWLRSGEVDDESQVAEGSGAVMRRGMHRIAVYRDTEGELHQMSARCTHLGCSVRWNPADNSWDCKCHGSRFNAYGRVISGPAVADLPPAEIPARAPVSHVRPHPKQPGTSP